MSVYKHLKAKFHILRSAPKYILAALGAAILFSFAAVLVFSLYIRISANIAGLSAQPPISHSDSSYPSQAACISAKSIEANIIVQAARSFNMPAPSVEKTKNEAGDERILVRYVDQGEPFLATYYCGSDGAGFFALQRDPAR